MTYPQDTIVAIATPRGYGGIGIVRISGKNAFHIAQLICQKTIFKRQAEFCRFYSNHHELIDEGIAIYFQAPFSFTGEDVIELQSHGSPIVLDQLIETCVFYGARIAEPGEFSKRAFLNDKIDLAQAEAIADLIQSSTKKAAKAALHSLQGEFSKKIDQLIEKMIYLRVFVESTIDFPDEDIDFIHQHKIIEQIDELSQQLKTILISAKQGQILREGFSLIIAGLPNAGKSSLLNVLAENDVAIVTEIAGTTRDVLKHHIQIDGLPIHIIDTAGIRDSHDIVEQEGIKRAKAEIEKADHLLWLIDATNLPENNWYDQIPKDILQKVDKTQITFVVNKIDLIKKEITFDDHIHIKKISAKKHVGIDELKSHLKIIVGFNSESDDMFIARRRHVVALNQSLVHVVEAKNQLTKAFALELTAEELLQAQNSLSEITGKISSDELLGKIFSTFCIGK